MSQSHAFIVVDLGYGDAGKGTMVEYLAKQHNAHTVVRFNGGAQAGHNIVTPDGRHHTFSQFGAATCLANVRTYLSRFMIVHPLAMLAEEEHLRQIGIHDAFERTSCSAQASVITPFHQAMCRLRELARGDARHGSVGVGVGETVSDMLDYGERMLVMGDLNCRTTLGRKLADIRAIKREQLRAIEPALRALPAAERAAAKEELDILTGAASVVIEMCLDDFADIAARLEIVQDDVPPPWSAPGNVVFEAAQGVLLDEWYGFHPYTTWSTTTFQNALQLLEDAQFSGQTTRIGVTRTHATRHGAGPFVTEQDELADILADPHNNPHPWQGSFRVGWLDLVATRYALEVCGGADMLAVTHLDQFAPIAPWKVAHRYAYHGSETLDRFFETGADPHHIKRIVPNHNKDLEHQEGLARRLFQCAPITETIEASAPAHAPPLERLQDYLAVVEDALQTKVVLGSQGPTVDDKLVLRTV